jgi:hypothetical protein
LYLRATRAGVVDAPFVVCYEPPEPAPPSLRYRLARVEARIQVTPSLAIHARVSASATHPAARVVRVAARNVSASSTFFVRAVRLLAADDEGRNDVCLRPAVRVYGQLVRSAASSKTQTRGLLIEPGKARDAVFLAGPAEALVANDAVRQNDEKDENVSDVVSYVGLEVDASFDDAEVDAAHVAALERLVRASLSFAASAKSAKARDASRHEKASSKGPERDGRRDPNPPTKGFAAFRGDKSVVVEWEAVSNESGARLFFGAHAFSASRSFALPDAKEDKNDGHFFRDHRDTRDVVRFTLEGPSASSIETSTSEKPVSSADGVSAEGSVSARFLLRAHNPSRFPKRVTFESAQRGARVDSNVSHVSSFTERDDEEKEDDGSHAGVPASGWIHAPRNDAVDTKTRGRAEEKLTSLPPGPPWLWTGPTRRSATVSPGATATVELVATAFTPGVFVLNEYRLIVRSVGDVDESGAGSGAEGGDEYVATPEDAADAPFLWTVVKSD